MDIDLLKETGDPSVTLKNLRKFLSRGMKVKRCEIRGEDIIIVFDDFEYNAVGFKIGQPCRPFAEFVAEAGLDDRVDEIERYLAILPPDETQGEICWVGFEKLVPWDPKWDSD